MTRQKLHQMSVIEVADWVISEPTHELASEMVDSLARLFGVTDDYTNEKIAKAIAIVSRARKDARIPAREVVR